MKQFAAIFSFCCLLNFAEASDDTYQASFEQIAQYRIPEDHQIKKTLDSIISDAATRVFYDMKSMTDAGFAFAKPQPTTQLIVTKHPKLKGYIIKAYLDTQKYYGGRPEYYYWTKRAEGANLIREAIKKYKVSHLLKVPKKWIYELADKPCKPLPGSCKPKRFILVEEDMNIYDDETNKKLWSSPKATKELLFAMHTIITEFRFRDCAKPANCPFSKDGRVAFVDTQSFYKKRIGYNKLTPYLSPEMQTYWKSLSHVGVKG